VKKGAQPKSFRLTQDAVDLLKRCSDAKGVSETAAVEIAIRDLARKWLKS
jgi:hypothetical protein